MLSTQALSSQENLELKSRHSALTESGETVGPDSGEANGEATLTKSTVWLMLGKSAAFAFNFALPLVLVRRLDQSAFGMYKQVFLVVTTAMALLPFGFGQSACYFLPRGDERPQQIVLNILLFHLFVAGAAALLLMVQPNLLAIIFNNPELAGYGPLVGLALLLWVMGSVLETFAAANREFRLASGFILAAQFTKSVLLLTAAVSFGSMKSLIWAAILQGLAQMALLLLYLRSRFRNFWREFQWPVLGRQLAYAMPFGLAAALSWIQSDLHNFVVSHELGAAAYAIYSIGCLQLPLVVVLNESIGYVIDTLLIKDIGKLGIAAVVAGLAAMFARSLVLTAHPLEILILSTMAFSFVYLGAVLSLGVLLPNEREWLGQLVIRLRRLAALKVEGKVEPDPLA